MRREKAVALPLIAVPVNGTKVGNMMESMLANGGTPDVLSFARRLRHNVIDVNALGLLYGLSTYRARLVLPL